MKPIIGISTDSNRDPSDPRSGGKLTLNWNYAEAVVLAGGVPILVPPNADMSVVVNLIDGWLIPGGADIDAATFGEENHPAVELQDPARYAGEKALLDVAPADLPVLGICYGCQFLNVARGGSLIQHLPDVVGHETHAGGTLQDYSIDADSKLAKAAGTSTMQGKSYHHQAVKQTGEGLRVVAKGEDGTVEAIEAKDRPWMIGVQWHPERTVEDEATMTLFRDFVEAARKYAETRRA